jgi:hypothetical protein
MDSAMTGGKTMDLPIRFPSEFEVIDEDVARFRALSAEEQVRSIRDLFSFGAYMMQISPKRAFIREYILDEENRAWQAVREFVKRHACPSQPQRDRH